MGYHRNLLMHETINTLKNFSYMIQLFKISDGTYHALPFVEIYYTILYLMLKNMLTSSV